MPIKKAAFKALKQDKKRRGRNLKTKNEIKTLLVDFRKAVTKKDKAKAEDLSKKLIKILDKAAQAKIIKKNTASRRKSRLMKKLNLLGKG